MKVSLLLLIFLLGANKLLAQVKIGVVNKQQLLDSLPSRIAVLNEIKQIENAAVKELTALDSTLQAMFMEYQKSAGNCTLYVHKPIGCSKENQMRDMQIRISIRENQIERELELLNNASLEKSEEMILLAAEIVANRLSLEAVIGDLDLQFVADKIDITNQVFSEMVRIDETAK